MRRLKNLYIVYAIFTVAAFYALNRQGIASYPFINVALFLIAPAGYIYKVSFSYRLIISSWLIVFPASLAICKVDPLNAALPVAVFNGLVLGLVQCRSSVGRARLDWEDMLKGQTEFKESSSAELGLLKAEEDKTREEELSIVNLYEITKKMSESLKFSDIFAILSLFLKESFGFRKCELILLRAAGGVPQPGRVYKVWGKGHTETEAEEDHGAILALFSDARKEVRLARDGSGEVFAKLGIEPAVETFLAMPLLSEKKMVGVLTVEDLARPDAERFMILAAQFSLEIKKVLLYETVEELAITDSLTGLYVRRYFLERLGEEIERSRRHAFSFAFIMLDIDNFKRCNDTYGHLVGDVILKEIAALIRENVRQIDLVGRYGGEEFAVLLPETDGENAYRVAERIRAKVEESIFAAYDEKLKMTISSGISVYPLVAEEPWDVIDKADRALYDAKNSGKNLVRMYKT